MVQKNATIYHGIKTAITMYRTVTYLTGYEQEFTDKYPKTSGWVTSLKLQGQTMLNMCSRQVL